MANEGDRPKPQWLGSVTAKVLGATALVAAVIGLVNGGIDLYQAIAKVPTNIYEKTNDELFKKNFGKAPLLSQPINIKSATVTVEMLLQVYDTGDIFVRYGDFQQWLPFRPLRTASLAIFPEARAQTSDESPASPKTDTPLFRPPINIDIDSLKIQQLSQPLGQPTIERSFVLARIKADHQLFGRSTETFTETFRAEPGYKITNYDLQLGSATNYRIERVGLVDDGRAVRVRFSLTSGPAFDRYRGWIQGTVKTQQERIE